MTIGERIKDARKYRKLTQKQLAEAANVATGTIQQYELGKRKPSFEILNAISRALNISVAALCEERDIPTSYFAPEVVRDAINVSQQCSGFLSALGFEIIDDYETSDGRHGCLIVDHKHEKLLFLGDIDLLSVEIEQSITSYAKFVIGEKMLQGEEIPDGDGWLSNDPRKAQMGV